MSKHQPLWVLMPSIADDLRRKRYIEILRAVDPKVGVLPEPEMVLEYFRLVRRDLVLKRDHTGIYLVIDVGASTCNMTFVLTRRDATVVEAKDGHRRQQRLRSASANSSTFGGRWVDEQLADTLRPKLRILDSSLFMQLAWAVEPAKIATSSSRRAASVGHPSARDGTITVPMLEEVADALWRSLVPLYQDLAQRLYAQMTGTENAIRLNAAVLKEHAIESGADVHRVIDAVLVAGGTSQLPGFLAAMKRHIFDGREDLDVLSVGQAYATAAAVGALAHVLDRQDPPKLILAPAAETSHGAVDLASASYDGALSGDVVLKWRGNKRDGVESGTHLLMPAGDSFGYSGGTRSVEGLPAWPSNAKIDCWLAVEPGFQSGPSRPPKLHRLEVRRSPPKAEFLWDAAERIAKLKSRDLGNASSLFLDAKHRIIAPTEPPNHEPPNRGIVEFRNAADVVVDLGMSKTVVLTAESGRLDVEAFERSEGRSGFLPLAMEPGPAAEHAPEPNERNDGRPVLDHDAQLAPGEPSQDPSTALTDAHGSDAVAIPSSAVPPAVEAAEHPPRPDASVPRPRPSSWASFTGALAERVEALPEEVRADVVTLVMALLSRPFVLLTGPPGCGKSSLVRAVARLLGLADGFIEVQVMPHWKDHQPLFGEGGELAGVHDVSQRRLVLLDEVNLARPEFYLWHLINSIDDSSTLRGGSHQNRRWWVCGTLNVDDMSRPPSPKVVDRSFLMEMDAPRWRDGGAYRPSWLHDLDGVDTRRLTEPTDGVPSAPSEAVWRRVASFAQAISTAVAASSLRQDLEPSHRAISDVRRFLSLCEALDEPLASYLTIDDALDRAISGRLLVKLSGASEQVQPVIKALEPVVAAEGRLRRCRRKIKQAQAQLTFGFVSPWQ